MSQHQFAQRIATLHQRAHDLGLQFAALQRQRDQTGRGSDAFVTLSGLLDAVAVDLDDTLADLRQLRRAADGGAVLHLHERTASSR